MANIKIVRLASGEEILGDILEGKETIRVTNPARIVIMPNRADPNNPQIGLAPFCQWAEDKEITVGREHVLCVLTPVKEFQNQYNQAFSNILVPDSQLIIPGA
jgi:hypothetical protein